jgi:hypothetical protein
MSLCLPVTKDLYWEDLSKEEQNKILQSTDVDKDIKSFIFNDSKMKDDTESLRILDSISTLSNNTEIKALYFYLFNQICKEADGIVCEMLGNYCQKIILSDIEYTIKYLKNKPLLRKKYAGILGFEFYFKEEGTSDMKYGLQEFKGLLNKDLKNKDGYNSFLQSFYKEIELVIMSMD